MNTVIFESCRKMRNTTTLKSVLNRQCYTLGLGRPVESGLFDCRRETKIGTEAPTITFKPFERVFRIPTKNTDLSRRAS